VRNNVNVNHTIIWMMPFSRKSLMIQSCSSAAALIVNKIAHTRSRGIH